METYTNKEAIALTKIAKQANAHIIHKINLMGEELTSNDVVNTHLNILTAMILELLYENLGDKRNELNETIDNIASNMKGNLEWALDKDDL